MSLLHRLSLPQKFIILGLVALLMAVLPTVLLFQRSFDEIDVALREDEGTAPAIALQRVLQLTQHHRGIAAGPLGGNEALATLRPQERDEVAQAIAAVDASLATAHASATIPAACQGDDNPSNDHNQNHGRRHGRPWPELGLST